MKLFVIMIGIATAIGGFVGGRITDSTFSFLGSLVGGVGLIICILEILSNVVDGGYPSA